MCCSRWAMVVNGGDGSIASHESGNQLVSPASEDLLARKPSVPAIGSQWNSSSVRPSTYPSTTDSAYLTHDANVSRFTSDSVADRTFGVPISEQPVRPTTLALSSEQTPHQTRAY